MLYNRVGRWWGNRDVEIDIVALDTLGGKDILFGECKLYETEPVGVEVLNVLQKKAVSVNWGGADRRETYVLFSESGFTEELTEAVAKQGNVRLLSCLEG